MIPASVIETIKPKGLAMKVTTLDVTKTTEVNGVPVKDCEYQRYECRITGKIFSGEVKETTNQFAIPIPKQGVFTVGGLYRFVIPLITVDVEKYAFDKPIPFYGISRSEILVRGLAEVFDRVYFEFFISGRPVTDHMLQNEIDTWFKTSKYTREVKPTEISLDSIKEMVQIKLPDDGLDIKDRNFPVNLLGFLDPASTPSGEKINSIYRMVKGAKIVDSVLVKGPSLFCSTIENYHLPVSLCPRRTHIVRSAYENSIQIDAPETPYVGNPGLSGVHLLTAVTNYRTYTGDDAIVISESAAHKLRATRRITEQFHSLGKIDWKVKEGDVVVRHTVLAVVVDPITQEQTEVVAQLVRGPAVISKISAVRSNYFGIPSVRFRVFCDSLSDMKTGDKIITRSAIKGVVRVIPTDEMPKDHLTEQTVEAIVSPESVVGRRAMSFYWEGMANSYAQQLIDGGKTLEETRKFINADHLDPRPNFSDLVQLGFGKTRQLTLNGDRLSHRTWISPIFFVRLDKIAGDILSSFVGKPAVNGLGLKINAASSCGQKKDTAKAIAMSARHLDTINMMLHKENAQASFAFKEIQKVVRGE